MSSSQVKIASGQSLSGVVDLRGWTITAIEVPSSWTAANITLAASATEGGTFVPVYDASGTELEVTAAASRFIVVAPDATRAIEFVKIRSGTSSAGVNQAGDRVLTLHLSEASAS